MSTIIYLPFDGTEISAWVTEAGPRHRSIYRVLFSNEYENVFYRDVENGKWIEEDLGYTELAREVGKRIHMKLSGPVHVPKLLNWHSEELFGKTFRFGFTSLRSDNQQHYEIYNSDKKYLYTLIETDENEWEILGNPEIIAGKLDTDFVENVVAALRSFSEKEDAEY